MPNNEQKLISIITLLLCLYFIISVTFIMVQRIAYPFELEWMEGGTVEHIIRILEGNKIYTKPTIEFIPYIYTPFFNYVGSFFSLVFGSGFLPLRLISVLSVLGICFIIYRILFEESKTFFFAIVGIALFLASYGFCGFWYDLARVDSLANFLTILGFYFLLKEKNPYFYLSIFFSFLAFYTKQSQLITIIIFILPLIIESFKKFFVYIVLLFSLVLLSTIIENFYSNGWYIFWNFTLPRAHHWVWDRAITFWTLEILPHYSIGFLFLITFFLDKTKSNQKKKFFLALFFGSLVNSFVLRLHYGGYYNVFIPMVISIAIILPLALFNLQQNNPAKLVNRIIYLGLIIQLTVLIFKPDRAIPKSNDLKTGWEFINILKNFDGEVFIPGHCFISRYAGKKSYTHYVLLNDLFISNLQEKNELFREWEKALKEAKFQAIILDKQMNLPLVEEYYEYKSNITNEAFFSTPTGRTNPVRLYLPKSKIKQMQ